MAFASEYLNLDYETSSFANHTVEIEPRGSPFASRDPSTGPPSTAGDVEMQWGIPPTSLALLDPTKFELELDANGVETRNPWPWGDFTYRPPSPLTYPEPEEYLQECQMALVEEELRAQLAERLVEEAIRDGEEEERRCQEEKRKSEEVERMTFSPAIAAFSSREIRGRTIYNP